MPQASTAHAASCALPHRQEAAAAFRRCVRARRLRRDYVRRIEYGPPAAELPNVSRPYLVGLSEKGEMPFRSVGNQPLVRLQEVMAYKAHSDADRSTALDELARLGQEVGIGYEV